MEYDYGNLEKVERLSAQKNAISEILRTDNGKLMLEFLTDVAMGPFGVYVQDVNSVYFAEGKRNVLVAFLALANMDFNEYLKNRLDIDLSKIGEKRGR